MCGRICVSKLAKCNCLENCHVQVVFTLYCELNLLIPQKYNFSFDFRLLERDFVSWLVPETFYCSRKNFWTKMKATNGLLTAEFSYEEPVSVAFFATNYRALSFFCVCLCCFVVVDNF